MTENKLFFTPLHLKVIKNEPITDSDINDKEIDTFDSYGIPVLHYAIHMQNIPLIELLLKHNADPLIRNKNGFNSYQEATCTRNIEIIEMLYDKTYEFYEVTYDARVIDGAKTLGEMTDFTFTFKWELQSWIPLAGYLLPSDVNLMRKKGPNLRFDMTISGFENYRLKRGNSSLIFFGEDRGRFTKGQVVFIDHTEKTIKKLCGCGFKRNLKKEHVLKTNLTTMSVTFPFAATAKKTMFGNDKYEVINGMQCKMFDCKPFWAELTTREPLKTPPKPKVFKERHYTEEYYQEHKNKNILLRKNEKQVFRKKTLNAEFSVGKNHIPLSQFRKLISFLAVNFDNFQNLEDFFDLGGYSDEDGFPVKFKIPLALSLSAVATITNYSNDEIDDSVFDLGEEYTIIN